MRYPPVFTAPLPGKRAQLEMAPLYRAADLLREAPPENAIDAAVLAVLSPANEKDTRGVLPDWTVLLIRRTTYPGAHSGQISFPGGRREKSDKELWETACRETFEEVNIKASHLEKVCPLTSLYIPLSNFLIHPFVAVNRGAPPVARDKREVVDCKQIPIGFFNPAEAAPLEFDYRDGEKRTAPAWRYEDYTIWGATAMILSELYRLVERDSGRRA